MGAKPRFELGSDGYLSVFFDTGAIRATVTLPRDAMPTKRQIGFTAFSNLVHLSGFEPLSGD